jgi:hypothetical protein
MLATGKFTRIQGSLFRRRHPNLNWQLWTQSQLKQVIPWCEGLERACAHRGKKGKAVPLRSIQAHLGERRYSSYSFLTSALEGGEWSASRPGRALPPRKEPPVPTVQEAGGAPEPVWTQRLEEKSSASVGDRTPAVQSVVRHYSGWATRLLRGP